MSLLEQLLMPIRLPMIIILLFVFGRPVFAEKDFGSGNYMFPHCKALVDNKPPGVWEGQCGGVIDALVWVGSALPEPGHFCAPAHIPPSQAQRVVALYMERHPEKLHEDFKGLALSALTEAWPCEKK
jgi:hypothetical protein